jgi:Flp pilus assembly protein TadG
MQCVRDEERPAPRAERGAAIVEFALCLPLLAILVFAGIDVGRAYATSEWVKSAAREGALYASRESGAQQSGSGACADPNNATWHAVHEGGPVTVTFLPSVSSCTTDPAALASAGLGPGQPVRVTVTAQFRFLTPLGNVVLGGATSISSSVCVTIAGAAPSGAACP